MKGTLEKEQASRPYIHGHHESVVKSHATRTAANSCAYLLPYIKPTDRILDIGCGPGSITLDLAGYVPKGSITGIDIESARPVLDVARKRAADGGKDNVTFQVGDISKLPFSDGSFDIVHVHQVIQHVPDPVGALKEMWRVCRVDGLIAVREVAEMVWYPGLLDEFFALYKKVATWTGGTPFCGKQLKALAGKAGFKSEEIVMQDASTWCYSTPKTIETWATMWADRIAGSSLKSNALDSGFATQDDLDRLREVWLEFAKEKDAWFALLQGEIILKKSEG
jgi:ubiquinone/menaquinone biosynthesis C-methylase UbiE